MIDRHAVHALLKAGHPTKDIALQMGVTQRTIQRIAQEPLIWRHCVSRVVHHFQLDRLAGHCLARVLHTGT